MKETLFWKAMALAHKGKLDEIRTEVKELYGERNDLMTELNSCVGETKKSLLNIKISMKEKELNFCIKQSLRKRKCYLRCLHKADSIEFEKITDNIAKEVLEKFGINIKDEISELSKLLNPKELKEALSYCQSNKEKLNTQEDITKLLKGAFQMDEKLKTTKQRIESFIVNELGINLCSVKNIEINRQSDSQLKEIKIEFIPST